MRSCLVVLYRWLIYLARALPGVSGYGPRLGWVLNGILFTVVVRYRSQTRIYRQPQLRYVGWVIVLTFYRLSWEMECIALFFSVDVIVNVY